MLSFFGGRPGELRGLMAASLDLADEWTGAALVMFRGNLEENEGNLDAHAGATSGRARSFRAARASAGAWPRA